MLKLLRILHNWKLFNLGNYNFCGIYPINLLLRVGAAQVTTIYQNERFERSILQDGPFKVHKGRRKLLI